MALPVLLTPEPAVLPGIQAWNPTPLCQSRSLLPCSIPEVPVLDPPHGSVMIPPIPSPAAPFAITVLRLPPHDSAKTSQTSLAVLPAIPGQDLQVNLDNTDYP